MATVLVVANETLASQRAARRRARARGRGATTRLVGRRRAAWPRPASGLVSYDDVRARGRPAPRRRAWWPSSSASGSNAQGEVMDPDPFSATMDAVREFDPDEIIISTHPETRSGWLRRDLLERVAGRDRPARRARRGRPRRRGRRGHATRSSSPTRRPRARRSSGLLKGKAEEKRHRFIVVVPQQGPTSRGRRGPRCGCRGRRRADRRPASTRRGIDRRPRPLHRGHERPVLLQGRRDRHLDPPAPPARAGCAPTSSSACAAPTSRPGRARRRRHRGARSAAVAPRRA